MMDAAVYIWAPALVMPVGALLTLAGCAIHNRLGYQHWRMYCPRTAYPYPPDACLCRCKECRTCKRA